MHHKKKKASQKTNALRLLDTMGISYTTMSYEAPEGFLDGVSVAEVTGINKDRVFKTLVVEGSSQNHFVCLIPVAVELDLKKAAAHFGEKKIEMIPARQITPITGYIKGGCSPVGMKKPFPTAVDQAAKHFEKIVVSAGRVGLQMELSVPDLLLVIGGDFADLVQG